MADESIGGIQVDIVGNYSQLQTDIDTAASIAAAGGAEIANALNAGAEGADALSGAVTAAAVGLGSFESQIQALVESGSTLAEALAAVESTASGIAAGVEQAGSAAAAAAEQMQLFDQAVEVPFADAAGQLNLFATELEPITGAAQSAAQATEQFSEAQQKAGEAAVGAGKSTSEFGQAAHEAGQGAHEGSIEVGELATKLLEVAGIGLSIEAIREFGAACFETAAEEERMGEGIAFMRGNIAGAEEEINGLRALAQDLSQSFEEVGKASQNFAFLKFSAEDTADALHVADDAAKASGRNFESLASSLANISLSGMAMPRTLRQLGISTEELADVMNVSADKVKIAFRGMDESARLDALMAAMQATGGASKAMADDAESSMTRFGNAWTAAKGDVGAFITPFVEQMMPAVAIALKSVGTAAIEVVGGIQALVHVLAGIVATALDAIPALGKSILLALAGNISEASSVAATAIGTVTADVKNIWMQYKADADSTTAAVKKLWTEQAVTAKASSEDQAKSWGDAAKAGAAAALASAGSAAELKKQTAEVAAFAKAIAPALSEAAMSEEQYLTSLLTGGKTATAVLRQLTDEIVKGEAAAAEMSGAPLVAMNAWIAKLKEAQAVESDRAAMDAEAKAWSDIIDKRKAYAEKVAEEAEKINDQMVADAAKTALMVEQGELTHQLKLLEIDRSVAAARASIREITAFERLALDQQIDDKEVALEAAALQRQLQLLNEREVAEVDYASKREAILLKIQALQDKTDGKKRIDDINAQAAAYKSLGLESEKALNTQIREADQALKLLQQQNAAIGLIYAGEEKELQLRIKRDELTGKSATKEIIALENSRLKQQALYDQTHLLGDLYVGVVNDIIKGWDSLGKSIADNIIEEKNWGEVFLKVGKQVEKMILEDIVGAAFKALKNAVLGAIKDTDGLTSAFTKLGKKAAELFGGGADAAKTGAGAVKQAAGASAAGGGGALSAVGAVGSIVGAISSIFGNFQNERMISTLGHIEENTRRMDIVFEKFAQSDEWDRQSNLFAKLDDMWNAIRDVATTVAAGAQGIMDTLTALAAGHTAPGALPSIPGVQSAGATPSSATYSATSSTTSSASIGTVQFNVNGAQDPRNTARAIADSLKTLSPQFAAFAT